MYNEFYGFSEKPFEVIPDPKFIYLTSHHKEMLDSVIHGIRDRKEFISITGSAGTGKTAFVHYLLSILDQKSKAVFIPRPFATFKELISNILFELGPAIVQKGKGDSLEQLMNYLKELNDREELLVIVIDEAQGFSIEAMEALEIFSNQAPGLVQIILVGQPGLEDKINSPRLKEFKQRMKVRHQMKALTEKESSEYINHRLKLVGRSIFEIFTPNAIALIYRYSQGAPLSINTLCDNGLRVGYELSRKSIDADIIQGVIKELEGPESQPTPVHTTKAYKVPRPSTLRLNLSHRTVIFVILLLVSLIGLGGVFFLVQRGLQRRSAQWGGDIKISKRVPVDTQASEPGSVSPELVQPSPSSFVPRNAMPKEDKTINRVSVKMGQTLSFLSQQYYQMTNTTLLDFILDSNPDVTNVHLINVNQEIKIPKITETSLILPTPEGSFKIYLGTFGTPDFSKIYRNEPALKGKEIEIIPRKVSPQDTWYRIHVGTFDNQGEALKTIHLLKKKGLLPLLIKGLKTD